MLTVSCPHCGFAKEVPADKLPNGVVRVSCPSCKETFPFGRNAADVPEPIEEESVQNATTDSARDETTNIPKAGFWTRVAARCIDLVIVTTLTAILSLLLFLFSASLFSSDQGRAALVLIIWGFIVTTMTIYDVFFIGYCGQTPGKMAVRIKVIKTNGMAISLGRAFFREVIGKYVSRFIFCIGYLMVAFDKHKQGLHDKIADTYVIKL